MKNRFLELSGMAPEDAGDVDVRFKVLASQLCSISAYGDFILRQAFAQTAEGSYLDRHCEQNGIGRKRAERAQGSLTFSVGKEPAETDVEVPQGTLCSCEKDRCLSFETTEKGTVHAGETAVTVPAQALGTGEAYNAASGAVTVLVTPPAGIAEVVNSAAFYGGTEEENDFLLRRRLLEHLREFPNGLNRAHYVQKARTLEYVLDAKIFLRDTADGRTPVLVVRTDGSGTLTAQQRTEIAALFDDYEMIGKKPETVAAVPKKITFAVNLSVKSGFDVQETVQKIKAAVQRVFSVREIGYSLPLADVTKEISMLEGVNGFDFDGYGLYGIIPAAMTEYIELARVEVSVYD